MAEGFYFSVDQHLVPTDGSVIQGQDSINTTLTDTINDESYVTAEEDNATQYLSVLDGTGTISLENLNITLTHPKLEDEVHEEPDFISTDNLVEQVEEENDEQVVVYTVEGSDELYGIQVAQDEEGNFRKYQFQFRKNDDGQLEAIPETVQLLPMEEEMQETTLAESLPEEENPLEEESLVNEPHAMHIFVQEDNSAEHILPDSANLHEDSEEQPESIMYQHESADEDNVDIKPNLINFQNVKQEYNNGEEDDEEETEEIFPDDFQQQDNIQDQSAEFDGNSMEHHVQISEENSNNSPDHELIEMDQQEMEVEATDYDQGAFEHVEVNPDMNLVPNEETINDFIETTDQLIQENNVNESDLEDYHVVDGLHVTGDVDDCNNENILKNNTGQNPNFTKFVSKSVREIRSKRDNKVYYYVVKQQQQQEKENVDAMSIFKPVIANPRSVLKSSHAMLQGKNANEAPPQLDEPIGKRFWRGKEAVQARILHNFINKTTIPQAPVRQYRLPRKQKIKPVDRVDEEIVVQEVMVSSNGFVQTVDGDGINKENLEVLDYVELTDSDDEYTPRKVNNKKKRKKHKRRRVEIVISDEDESDEETDVDSVIELDDDTDDAEHEVPVKRRPGRPPKNRKVESPLKKISTEVTSVEETKPDIPCPKCDKSFPSQNSLKTHLQHHNLQNSMKNVQLTTGEKYKCDNCEMCFKSGILLKRHVCMKKVECVACKKKFPDVAALNIHKRVHAKEQLIKSTSLERISPKKIKPTTKTFKSPKKVSNFKCKLCGRMCLTKQSLNLHAKSHQEFRCSTCSTLFASRIMLERHVRENCVKSPKLRRSSRLKTSDSSSDEVKTPKVPWRLNCDKCDKKFVTQRALHTHKVVKHGLETPDREQVLKSFAETSSKKKIVKSKAPHGGVPVLDTRMRGAYEAIRRQLYDYATSTNQLSD